MTPSTSPTQPQSVERPQEAGAALATPPAASNSEQTQAISDSDATVAHPTARKRRRWATFFQTRGKKQASTSALSLKMEQSSERSLEQSNELAASQISKQSSEPQTSHSQTSHVETSEPHTTHRKRSSRHSNQSPSEQKHSAFDNDLSAQALVLNWFKAYPGLWISPLILGLLGGWVIAQPSPESRASNRAANVTAIATEDPLLPPFVHREAAPLGPTSPFGEAEAPTSSKAELNDAGMSDADNLIIDPPDVAALKSQTATSQTAASSAAAASAAAAFPGVPSEDPADIAKANAQAEEAKAQAEAQAQATAAAAANPTLSPEAKAQIAEQISTATAASAAAAAQAESEAQAQAAADAQAILAERARNQAAAFAQAQANQATSATPPQPAPPIQGNPEVDKLITMQVAIAEGDRVLSMGGSNQSVIMNTSGEALMQLEAGEYGMSCDGTGLVLKGQKLPATVMMAPYGGGLNYVRDRNYRGQIQFICQGNSVLAVNHIDMLQYLYSVVGSEVSASWPEAALKAQAVAARSYALTYYFRPAKKHFHIGDTESYQVYKGTISEHERVKSAVQATAGEFISYDGGIVESLYAASDDIVMEAFQGGGMSQLGALDFAQQGYNYLQILGYYYPETSLGRLVVEEGA